MFFRRFLDDGQLGVRERGNGLAVHHEGTVSIAIGCIGDERGLGVPLQNNGSVKGVEGRVDQTGLQ